MKLILTGDWHLRATTPAKRKDDFKATQRRKVEKILDLAEEHNAHIIQTGDVFDTEDPARGLVNEYLELLNSRRRIFSVPGNHDVYGADLGTVPRTAFQTLVAGGAIVPLSHEPTDIAGVHIYGHTYMHEDAAPTPVSKDAFNILVTHEMVLKDKLWKEQEDFVYAADYMKRQRGWDVILCGHYHYQFMEKVGDRVILNPGAIVRIKRSKGDMAMSPGVVLLDTEKRTCDWYSLDAAPVEEVFEMEPDGEPPIVNPDLDDFMAAIKPIAEDETISKGALADVVVQVLEQGEFRPEVATLVKKYIGLAQGGA